MGECISLCPVCLERVGANKVSRGFDVYLEKRCPEHGEFSTLIWEGDEALRYEDWSRPKTPGTPVNPVTQVDRGCPYDCGLCEEHRQIGCCVLLEVTGRCNLSCPLCFASSGEGADVPLEALKGYLSELLQHGGPFNIQLSGGEPTVRDDLPELIRAGKAMGYEYFQLNTNGLRLASRPDYAKELRDAGLDCVFLQFDGLSDSVYEALRGRGILGEKLCAVDNCAAAGLGVVLVPTLVPGVNGGEIGAILDFALSRLPEVRGVHFQPVSYFGRYSGCRKRLTLPALLRAIEAQTGGRMRAGDFSPASAENAYCSFSGNFTLMEDGKVRCFGGEQASCCCSGAGAESEAGEVAADEASQRAQSFVARRWGASKGGADPQGDALDRFLDRVERYTLAVSCMAFQDAWNVEIDRLRDCYILVAGEGGELVPFCAYNLTGEGGQALYRGRER